MLKLDKDLVRTVRAWDHAREFDLDVKITPQGVFTKESGTRAWFGPASWSLVHTRAAQVSAGVPVQSTGAVRRSRGRR